MAEEMEFDDWAIVELMGHRRLGARVSSVRLAGAPMLRLDVPAEPPFTQFVSATSLYALTPTTEAVATALARQSAPPPVTRFDLALPAPSRAAPSRDDIYMQQFETDDDDDGPEHDPDDDGVSPF